MVKNSLAVGRISLAANATASACHFSSQFSPATQLISFLAISIFAEKMLIFYSIAFFVTLFAQRLDCGKVSAASPPPGTASRRGG
jgi:hypothetical protein